MIIFVKSITQIGDFFFFSFNCPFCEEQHFVSKESRQAVVCGCNRSLRSLILSVKKAKRNLVIGTMRKKFFSIKKVLAMYQDQEGKCAYCLLELNHNYHIEHILPLSAGGTNRPENICLSCPSCNLHASNLVFDSFYLKQKYLLDIKYKRYVSEYIETP
jgi:5-methylcytosine-specific restriction endonuclease McrA